MEHRVNAKRNRNVAAGALLAALLSAPAQSQADAAEAAALAACFDSQSAVLPFAGAVLAQRGSESFFRAAGFADAEQRVPIRRDTRFRLASVTKMLTRTAIARLADQGRIALDAPVGRYVEGLPGEMAAATIEQLLHHRSGVAGLTELRALSPEELRLMTTAETARARLPLITARPLEFRPGEQQRYSNGGYFLLGAVIEAVSGRDYDAFLEQEIFRPLGMTASGSRPDARTAMPMSRMPDEPGQPPLQAARALADMGAARGSSAGGGIATVDDLAKLGRALAVGRFISPAVAERVYSRRGPGGSIWQNGGNVGQNTDFYVFPDSGWVVAVLSNFDPPGAEAMGRALSGVVAGQGCRTLGPQDFQRRL